MIRFAAKNIISKIGRDSRIAKLKSFQKLRKVPKSYTAVEIKYKVPELFA
jgi:hypothetical protein